MNEYSHFNPIALTFFEV